MTPAEVHTSKRVAAAIGWRHVTVDELDRDEPLPLSIPDTVRQALAGYYILPDGERREATGFLPAVNDFHALEAVDEFLATWGRVFRFSIGSIPNRAGWLAYAERTKEADAARGKPGDIIGHATHRSRPMAISLTIIETVGILERTDPDGPPGPGERPSVKIVQ